MTVTLLGLVLLARATPAEAQFRASALTVGGRVLAAQPVGDRFADLNPAVGYGVDVGYELSPEGSLLVGFSRVVYPVEGGVPSEVEDSGIEVGVLIERRMAGVPLWFRSALAFHKREQHISSWHGPQPEGDRNVGLESGLGVEIWLWGRDFVLLPGIGSVAYLGNKGGGVSHIRAEVAMRLRPL